MEAPLGMESSADLTEKMTLPGAPSVEGTDVFCLRVEEGPDRGRSFPLAVGSALVGTNSTCQLIITDRSVSREHLSLTVREDGVGVRDMGSKNGTFFEGARITDLDLGLGG